MKKKKENNIYEKIGARLHQEFKGNPLEDNKITDYPKQIKVINDCKNHRHLRRGILSEEKPQRKERISEGKYCRKLSHN